MSAKTIMTMNKARKMVVELGADLREARIRATYLVREARDALWAAEEAEKASGIAIKQVGDLEERLKEATRIMEELKDSQGGQIDAHQEIIQC